MSDKFSVLEELVDELLARIADLERERAQLRERLHRMDQRMKAGDSERMKSLETENRRLAQDRELIRAKVREMIRRIEVMDPRAAVAAGEAEIGKNNA